MDEKQTLLKQIKDIYSAPTTNPANFQQIQAFYQEVKKAEVRMKEKYGNEYFIATSKPIFLEVANVLVNKGKTLKKLGELLGISTEEMIAVGDSGNDAALLETVGMPVAVENATPEIKELSKFVVRENNDDALDDVIHHFFEIK